MLVRWKDQTESWIKLSDMKESHPVEIAEFAKLKGINDEPAFAWWTHMSYRKEMCSCHPSRLVSKKQLTNMVLKSQ